MKLIFIIVLLFSYCTITGDAYKVELSYKDPCSENIDSIYDRVSVLQKFAKILNRSSSRFRKEFDPLGFYVENQRPKNFFVFDLTDTLNRSFPFQNCIEFKNNHVYHFAPIRYEYSFSHLAILENGNLKVFKSINCLGKGDTLGMVLEYLRKTSTDEQIRRNVVNYRKFGIYVQTDPQTILRCPH